MQISVIIPTFNRSGLLRETLEGLCDRQAIERILEVIVVSDGSTDNTPATVAAFTERIPIRLITQAKLGVSAARNRGIGEAIGPVILFLDDDVVPAPSLIGEHADFHIQHPELSSVLLGYVTWIPRVRITPFMRWYGEHGALFGYASLRDGGEADRRYLYTCNISFKSEFLRRNNGFNETLSVHEDHELGYRLAKKGMQMIFRRSAVGYHNQSFTFQQACDRMRRYSAGFAAFRATQAGIEMGRNEAWWKKKLRRVVKSRPRQPIKLFSALLDSSLPMPHLVYRVAYWYYATLPHSDQRERDTA